MFQILLKDQVTYSDFMSQDFQKTGRKQSFDIFSKKSLNESVTNYFDKNDRNSVIFECKQSLTIFFINVNFLQSRQNE